ncbi:hypothetical protein WAF17_07825 [Bernardetia sp. ABR2-2B]|uniref:hypothetical protein n=1 Tax=Bernardetia sp. ABR2-2B TaxID=3127472 RepID=UPI0030CB96FE
MDSLIRYTDFQNKYSDYNAWKPSNAFTIHNTTNNCIEQLYKYEIVEQVFNGVGHTRDSILYAKKLHKFQNGLIQEFSKQERNNTYIYVIEHKKKKLSRIRSYKGLVDKKKIAPSNYCQNEFMLEHNETIISFITSLIGENVVQLLEYFFDDSTCFVIKSDEDYLNVDFLNLVLSTLDLTGNIELDYLKLLCLFCNKNDIIYRIGGNSGEDYWSLQKFIKK